jgi:hypothetical protein
MGWGIYRLVKDIYSRHPEKESFMTKEEFSKVWTLITELWFEQAKKRKPKVWYIGLQPYSMEEVTDRIMEYARNNKFFPDLADITAGLKMVEVKTDGDNQYLANMIKKMEAK